jgi:formate hydrogenlyase transcriptional activator
MHSSGAAASSQTGAAIGHLRISAFPGGILAAFITMVSCGMAGVDTLDDLQHLAAGASRLRGEALFPGLAQFLAEALGAAEVRITECVGHDRVRTRAVLKNGAAAPNYAYELAGTPCRDVLAGRSVSHEHGLAEKFELASGGHAGYFGVPLVGAHGVVLGHLCAFAQAGFRPTPLQRIFCDFVAVCAVADLERQRGERRSGAFIRYLKHEIESLHDFHEIVGGSAALAKVLDNVRRVAATDAAVLITGETGTGKELIARSIHATSRRAESPFIKVACAAAHADQAAVELFGSGDDPGRLRLAHGGTLFLDEIAGLNAEAQVKLLHALQEQEVERASSSGTPRMEVRILAATNRDLRKAVREGEFREDLYYRLNLFPVELPPLRARADDIPLLAHHFVRKYAPRIGRRVDGIDPDTLAALTRYAWPGNVRELENLVQRALILNSASVLKIPPELLAVSGGAEYAEVAAAATGMHRVPAGDVDLDDVEATGLHHVQREHILRVLKATHWVIEGNSGAALKLGMKPATLRHRMKKLGITRATNPAPP